MATKRIFSRPAITDKPRRGFKATDIQRVAIDPERVRVFRQDGRIMVGHPKGLSGIRMGVAPTRQPKPFYPKGEFSSLAEYDASVDDIVARIKSGEVKARTPDE